MRLAVTADDYGLTRATSAAVLDTHRSGIVTGTSVLVLAPGFRPTASWLADCSTLTVAVHLAVVGEDPPLCSAREIPSLVDRRGHLALDWRRLLPRLARGGVDPDDLQREFAAQLAAARDAGLDPTGLNTHQHVHLWPTVAEQVVGLATREGIAHVRVPQDSQGLRGRATTPLTRRLRQRVIGSGLDAPEAFGGLRHAGDLRAPVLEDELRRLALTPAASAELVVHPGAATDPDRARYRWSYAWGEEATALRRPELRLLVAELGFRLEGEQT